MPRGDRTSRAQPLGTCGWMPGAVSTCHAVLYVLYFVAVLPGFRVAAYRAVCPVLCSLDVFPKMRCD